MPIYLSRVANREKNIAQPDDSDMDFTPVDVSFPATPLLVNDTVVVCEVPAGVVLQDYAFFFPKIDSNATPTLAWSFGVLNATNTALTTVYQTGITAGQQNLTIRNLNVDCAQDAVNNALTRRLGLLVTAAAATYNGATRSGQVHVSLRG
jgi:hypothetical protein